MIPINIDHGSCVSRYVNLLIHIEELFNNLILDFTIKLFF